MGQPVETWMNTDM